MKYLTIIVLIFSVLGAADKIFGNRLGIGAEFERAFTLLGAMALSMIGMIVISPFIADIAEPVSGFFTDILHIDASVVPASLFANDMGGASLAAEMCVNKSLGLYNALVVSSMMGCTMSFTIPFALGVVHKSMHKELMTGLLCGIVTIPIGCIISGLFCRIPLIDLILNLIPLVIFSALIALGLILVPEFSIKVFKVFGVFISGIITLGLSLGIVKFLVGFEPIKGLASIEEGFAICLNAVIVLSGSFPFIYILSKLLHRPLKAIGTRIGVNEASVIGLVSSLASSANAFGMMERMDKKGIVINSAFAVSGAFVLGSHLAFTLAFDSSYVFAVVAGKIISGISAVILANVICKRQNAV
ncbi:MAG: ethanolamine utilization protein EutH [Clostridia bacterium]|nr:ethanolamine utilization protein EutH [Clostridia bacterium]